MKLIPIVEIAEKAGVSTSTIYRFRAGYLVRMEIAGKICAALGAKCEYMLDYERMEKYRFVLENKAKVIYYQTCHSWGCGRDREERI